MKKLIFIITLLLCAFSVQAKDLFVATTGSDVVTYANNDISNPWLTIEHAWDTAQSNDTVYFRAGVYSITTPYNSFGVAEYVTFTAYQSESVTWDTDQTVEAIRVESSHATVDGIDIDGGTISGAEAGFFRVGYNFTATHFTLKNSTGNVGFCSDNGGLIHAKAARANYLTIENCTLTGGGFGGGGLSNSAVIWVDNLLYGVIKNCVISNAPVGVYYKHSNARIEGAGLTLENNYIYGTNRADFLTQGNYQTIKNNIFAGEGVQSGFNGGESDPGGTGSDYNTYDHNTFYNVRWASYCSSGTDPGATNNTITNNVFFGVSFGPEYESSGCTEDMALSGDYNLFPSTTAVQYRSSNYTLENWKLVYSTDTNSISDTAIFVGGTPSTIAEYAVTSLSPGYQACLDNTDMGADVSLVGVDVDEATTLTLQADYETSSATTSFTFTGASADGTTVSSVVSNNGTAAITSGAGTDSVSGTVTGVSLTSGVNVVQVTLTDSAAGTDIKTINITYTPIAPTYTAKAKKCTLKNVTLK